MTARVQASERQQTRAVGKTEYIDMVKDVHGKRDIKPRLLASAVCAAGSAVQAGDDDAALGFMLLELADPAAPGVALLQAAGRVIVNQAGQCRALDRFRCAPPVVLRRRAGRT